MINPTALSDLLKKAINKGIETIFISTLSGGILCMEGKELNKTILDILSAMWIEYYQVEETYLNQDKLNYLLIENDTSNVLTSNLYGYIITIIANKKFKLGLLKYHLEHIVNFLSISLEPYKDVLLSKND
jgi:predicted regulator of Ras-like GTPase activity (Roadblock/LC7/MglB family)